MLEPEPSSSPQPHTNIAAVVIVLACGGALGGYAIAHEHNAAQSLAQQNQTLAAENRQTLSALDATQQQVSALTAKVSSLAASQAQAPSSASAAGGSHSLAARRIPKDDPRFKKLQSQLDAEGQAIDQTRSDLASTQGDLSSARTELTGSIAHTHDELVTLEKKGERSYTEFDIQKSRQFQREGPIEIRVRKADNRHQFADLDLLVDDRNLTQKHVNLYQPVMYSTPDTPQPVEVVINSVTKDHIHGYVAASKYKQSDLASMASPSADEAASQNSNAADQNQGGNQNPAANSAGQPSQRQKLPPPM